MSFLPSKARRKAGLLFLGLPIASPPIIDGKQPPRFFPYPSSTLATRLDASILTIGIRAPDGQDHEVTFDLSQVK